MLQQTRVATVIPYYQRFLERFPDVQALASSSEDDVLEHWAGLGYYSRGRNLRRAAQSVVREYDGEFPRTSRGLSELPGIGEYTAAAVGSIAFGEPVAVIDGNVERVLCRVFALGGDPKTGDTKRRLRSLANEAVSRDHAGDYNQAIMELGALICTPRSPSCLVCPIQTICQAQASGDPTRFPQLKPRRTAELQHWVAIRATVPPREEPAEPSHALVEQAADAELLPGHWGLPLKRLSSEEPEETTILSAARKLFRATFGCPARQARRLAPVRHGITYRKLVIHPVEFPLPISRAREHRLCDPSGYNSLPALFRKILRQDKTP